MAEEELSALMERLRQKSSEQKSWNDSIKALRSFTAEKRHLVETLDRIQIQRCLDTLQSAIKVLGQQSISSRLRCIAHQTSLNFTEKPPNNVIISSDMFYVEVCLDPEKTVKDVRVAQQGEATSCPELLRLLSSGDFKLFTKHLEGFSSTYTITGDKKQKTKAYHALQSLETDLNLVAQLQSSINGVGNYIHKSPLGILIPRCGGLPMKLIYFVSPYDLLDKKTKAAHPMTVEAIMEYELGQSVTVCLDSHSNTELQTMPLMTVNSLQDGKSLPYFSAISPMNSCSLPACFVLCLPKAIPLSALIARKIHSLTNIDLCEGLEIKPLLSLIVEDQSGGKMNKDSKLFVTLPNQHHQYYLQEGCGLSNQGAVLVSKIPFTHPTHVPKILGLLRQQLLFNALIGSCVRPSANQEEIYNKDVNSMTFEVTALSLNHVTVTFEHPLQQAMATAELDLSDITNVKCKVLSIGESEAFVTDEQATKVFQRCLSIPVTLRAMLMKVTGQLKKLMAEDQLKMSQRPRHMRPVPPLIIPRPYSAVSNRSLHHQNSAPLPHLHQQRSLNDYEHPALLDPSSASPELLDTLKAEKVAKNPMLASLLDQETGLKDSDSPVLSKLLHDQAPTVSSLPQTNQTKPRKTRKRKPDPIQTWSPKHRPSEDGLSDRSLELETPSPLDVRLSASSGGLTTPVIDLTDNESPFLDESHVSKLAHAVNKIIVDSKKSESPILTEPSLSPEVGNIVKNVDILTDGGLKWEAKDNVGSKRGSISDLWADPVESDGPIDPDLFTNKTVSSKLRRSMSRQSSVSQHSEIMEFDTDILNADTNFSESVTDNGSEEMGWDACDASAFGVGVNPVAEMASKLSSSSSVCKAQKASLSDSQPSKYTHDGCSAGIKRRLSETSESAAQVKVKTESDSPSHVWKKPDIELLNTWKNSECDLPILQRRKLENDSVFCRKSESDSCLSRKKSESDSVYKNTFLDGDSPTQKKSESETLLKKSESHSSDVPQGSRKKSDSDSNYVKKKLENDTISVSKKKSEASGSNLSKGDRDSPSPTKKKCDSDVLNTAKRKSESEPSSGKKHSEQCSVSNPLSATNKNWLKPDHEGQGLKMKISTRQLEGRGVSSPLQVLDLSKNTKSNAKNNKDSPLDGNRGGLAMAVTSVAYNSSALKGSHSPLLNSSISPKTPSFSPSKTPNYSPSSKSPSSHSAEKNSRSNKIDKSKKPKHSSNSESAKRKREKDEHKREKKKKKLEDLKRHSAGKEDLFYSATVDYPGLNDKKKMPKLKITKTGGKVTVQTSSPEKGPSVTKVVPSPRKSSQASIPIDDAFSFSRSEILEREELSQNLSKPRLHSSSSKQTNHSSSKSYSSSSQRSSHKSSQRSSSKSITVSKADSKLITKTPTIKLKPIVIPSSGASLNVSSSSKSPGSNVQASPQSASVLSASSSRLNTQSPHLSPSRNSSRSPTPIIGTLSGSVSTNSAQTTPSTPTVTNKSGIPPNLVLSSAPVSANSTSANKIKSPGRFRKGSLSAVIDKLTKSTSVNSSPVSDTPADGNSRAKVLAAVVSQQSGVNKMSNSTNSLSKSHTKSPTAVPSSKVISNLEREKNRTLSDSLSSVQKDSPKRDKADHPHKSRSDSSSEKSTQRKSNSSSSYERDKKSVLGSTSSRNGKDDKSKTENTNSKQSTGHSVKSSSSGLSNSQSPSSKHQTNSLLRVSSSGSTQSRKSISSPSLKYNSSPSGNQKLGSSTSLNQKSGNSPKTNQKVHNNTSSVQKSSVRANIIQKGGSNSSANSSKTSNSNSSNVGSSSQSNALTNYEIASVSSKTSGTSPSVVHTSANNKFVSKNSSNSSANSNSSSRVKDKVSQSSDKNNRTQPSENVQKVKSAKVLSRNGSSDRLSSKDSEASSDKLYSSSGENLFSGAISVEKKSEGRVDFDTWTPASPTEDKEHRSAEETAKIPVLERLQLEYTQESSNSPKIIPTIAQEAVGGNQPAKPGSLLSGLLLEDSDSSNQEKIGFAKRAGESTNLSEISVQSILYSQCNGETSDTVSASECKSPAMKDLPFSKNQTGNFAVKSDSVRTEHSSPKAKKLRTSSGHNCTGRQVSSPHSEASSPGSDLVIDCPTTPKSNSFQPVSPSPHSKLDIVATPCSAELPSVKKVSPGPSPLKLPRYSPAASPVFKAPSNSGSASPGLVDIDDDDLMDDIVLGMGS